MQGCGRAGTGGENGRGEAGTGAGGGDGRGEARLKGARVGVGGSQCMPYFFIFSLFRAYFGSFDALMGSRCMPYFCIFSLFRAYLDSFDALTGSQ